MNTTGYVLRFFDFYLFEGRGHISLTVSSGEIKALLQWQVCHAKKKKKKKKEEEEEKARQT